MWPDIDPYKQQRRSTLRIDKAVAFLRKKLPKHVPDPKTHPEYVQFWRGYACAIEDLEKFKTYKLGDTK